MLLLLFLVLVCGRSLKLGCIGDSITQGGCNVRPNETYVAQLAKLLKNYQVSNFGVSGMTMLTNGICGASKPQTVPVCMFCFVILSFSSFSRAATALGLALLHILRLLLLRCKREKKKKKKKKCFSHIPSRLTFTRFCLVLMTASFTIGLAFKTLWETVMFWTISN